MNIIFISIALVLFATIAIFRFRLALGLFFFLLPTYLIRFDIGPLPTTFLEVMFGILVIVWLANRVMIEGKPITNLQSLISNLQSFFSHNALLFTSIALFLLGATISIFTATDLRAALGEWKAFYVEPIVLAMILFFEFKNEKAEWGGKRLETGDWRLKLTRNVSPSNNQQSLISNLESFIIFALVLSGLTTSILAISQHFTGWMVPYDFWEKGNSFRVTAWYGFPNGVGLYLAPVVPLAIWFIFQTLPLFKNKRSEIRDQRLLMNERGEETDSQSPISNLQSFASSLFLLTAPLAIFYAKSTGALVGLAAGIGFLLLMYKKTRWPTIIIGLFLTAMITLPPLVGLSALGGGGLEGVHEVSRLEKIREELLFQDRSGQIRLSIWAETWEFLKDHPIRGAGLASYDERIAPYHTQVNGENIEIFHHPHNLFLTMWVNTGIIGLVGFIGIIVSCIMYRITSIKKSASSFLDQTLFATFITIVVMGLVDSPYIKNDLAILFWTIIALIIFRKQKNISQDVDML